MKDSASVLAAFFCGALVGAAAALLLAPSDGQSMRRNIREFIDGEMDGLKEKSSAACAALKTSRENE